MITPLVDNISIGWLIADAAYLLNTLGFIWLLRAIYMLSLVVMFYNLFIKGREA